MPSYVLSACRKQGNKRCTVAGLSRLQNYAPHTTQD